MDSQKSPSYKYVGICNLVIFSAYSFACIIIFCNFAERI